MIISGRIVGEPQENKNGTYYLVKPLRCLSNADYKFKLEYYVVPAKSIIKHNEHIAFEFEDRNAGEMLQFPEWAVPTYWLTTTNVPQMMQSTVLSAMPEAVKKYFLKRAEENYEKRNDFRKVADMKPDVAAKFFKMQLPQATRMVLQVKRANYLQMEYSLMHALHIYPKSVDKLVEIISGSNGLSRALVDPYALMEENGMTFKLCDLLGSALKLDKKMDSRVRAAVRDSIQQLVSNGNSAFQENRILKGTSKNLGFENKGSTDSRTPQERAEDTRTMRKHISGLVQDLSKIGAHNVLTTHEMYEGEAYVGSLLKTFVGEGTVTKIEPDLRKIPDMLNVEQRQGILNALEHRFSIITGGPGTGKTTVLKSVVDQFPKDQITVGMSAPTGKAARRISESSGLEAQTLHSLLGFSPGKGFKYNKKNPLPQDVVVVDEFSMVDLNMFRNLLDAIKPGARLIMVGDSDQLPSVDQGNVLQDLIDSKMFAVTQLVTPHRAALESYVTRTAISMRSGIMPDMRIAVAGNTEFIFIPENSAVDIRDRILRLPNEIVDRFGVSFDDIQILSPQKNTIIGVDSLNEHMRIMINPNDDFSKPSIKSMGIDYSVGDKIMQTKNNKELGISNGDVGKIIDIDYRNKTVGVDFDSRYVQIPISKMYEIKHAFAMTVHKSQGSEYSDVIMPFSMDHAGMLTRRLGYTGFTRTKQRFWGVGDIQAFEYMIKNTREIPRETVLKYLIGADHAPGNYYHRAKTIPSQPSAAPF
jgi:exodeoxyribonuclease V alpha subunit